VSIFKNKNQNKDPSSVTKQITELNGKTVKTARQVAGDFHSLDEGYAQDGAVIIEFTDGTTLTVDSHWCNDETVSTEYVLTGES
jgi:hypothetical protein